MKLSLIGMSGIGKSYWSKKLEEMRFIRFCCDDLIEKRLEPELQGYGYSGIHDMARWLGQPYDPQYAKNSQKYLHYEQEVVDEILSQIEHLNENIVIDTTGSVIYLEPSTLRNLKRVTKVIYLSTSESAKRKMYNLYLRHPKPVMWGDQFSPRVHETHQQALERCYLNLLADRAHKYAELADIILDYEITRDLKFDIQNFLQENKSKLEGKYD